MLQWIRDVNILSGCVFGCLISFLWLILNLFSADFAFHNSFGSSLTEPFIWKVIANSIADARASQTWFSICGFLTENFPGIFPVVLMGSHFCISLEYLGAHRWILCESSAHIRGRSPHDEMYLLWSPELLSNSGQCFNFDQCKSAKCWVHANEKSLGFSMPEKCTIFYCCFCFILIFF